MAILNLIFASEGETRTSNLSARFKIEPNLLAHDLRTLEGLGLVERGYGWVRRRIAAIDDIFRGSEFSARAARAAETKERIATHIAEKYVFAGSQLIMDAGSTAYAVGRHIVNLKRDVTLWTNSIPLFLYALTHSDMVCHLVGGEASRAHAALVGDTPGRQIGDAKFDLAIVTPKGLVFQDLKPAREGPLAKEIASVAARDALQDAVCVTLFNEDYAQIPYKQTMVRNANRVVVAIDQDKLSAVGQPFLAVLAPVAWQKTSGAVRTRGAGFARGPQPMTPTVEVRAPGEVTVVTDATLNALRDRNPELSSDRLRLCCDEDRDHRPLAVDIELSHAK